MRIAAALDSSLSSRDKLHFLKACLGQSRAMAEREAPPPLPNRSHRLVGGMAQSSGAPVLCYLVMFEGTRVNGCSNEQ